MSGLLSLNEWVVIAQRRCMFHKLASARSLLSHTHTHIHTRTHTHAHAHARTHTHTCRAPSRRPRRSPTTPRTPSSCSSLRTPTTPRRAGRPHFIQHEWEMWWGARRLWRLERSEAGAWSRARTRMRCEPQWWAQRPCLPGVLRIPQGGPTGCLTPPTSSSLLRCITRPPAQRSGAPPTARCGRRRVTGMSKHQAPPSIS